MKEERGDSLIDRMDRIAAELNAYRRLYPEPPDNILEEELQIQRAKYSKPPGETEKKAEVLQVQGNVIQFPGR